MCGRYGTKTLLLLLLLLYLVDIRQPRTSSSLCCDSVLSVSFYDVMSNYVNNSFLLVLFVGQMQELKTQQVLENASLFCAEHPDITHPCCCYSVSVFYYRLCFISSWWVALIICVKWSYVVWFKGWDFHSYLFSLDFCCFQSTLSKIQLKRQCSY